MFDDDDDFELPDELADMADIAAAALAEMGEEYAKDACKDADRLLEFAKNVLQPESDEAWAIATEKVFGLAHDFKGQGQTFGYDLVTKFGEALCVISRPQNNPTRDDATQVVRLSAAIHSVLNQQLTGDGGDAGAKLCAELGLS
ncbi:MAG: hypothetical protein COA60_008835 [Robiginitomaculum sp.]|nr:hypothetical protein [Robiginitomaculum sp.]